MTASEPEARRVLERLKGGEDFAVLAKNQSIDPSAHDDGYLGNLDPASLRRELREALNGVGAGQISAIVKIPSGYAIIKVMNEAPGKGLNPAPGKGLNDSPGKGPNPAPGKVSNQAPGKGPNPATPTKLQAVAGAGAVRLTYDYAGFAAALLAVQKFDKPAGWDRDLHQACEVRVQSVAGVLEQLQALMARPNATAAFTRDVNALRADLHAYRGDLNEAIGDWQAAYEVALASFPEKAPQLEESLGVAHLQKAGSVLYGDFVFPHALSANAVGEPQKEDLKKAAEYFLKYLKREPADGEVRWLLNLTYMLSGQYPGGVPKEFLVAPAVWESQEDVVHFKDVAAAAGVNRRGQAGGAIVDDFDNDGVLDIVTSSMSDCDALGYYHGNGDGTFTNLASQAGLANITGGLNIIQTDYNNDGCKDILVLRGGWEYPRPKSLLRNNCNGTFTDVTRESGLEQPLTATQTGVWADIDNDGKLDLFVGNENAPSQLFLIEATGPSSISRLPPA